MGNIGEIRSIEFAEGVTVTDPSGNPISAAQLDVFANDAAYEAEYAPGSQGNIYFNSTTQKIRVYNNGAWSDITGVMVSYDNSGTNITAGTVQGALTELDADLDAHIGDTVDAHDASAISYDNTASGLVADNTQAAIDEVEARLDAAENTVAENTSDVADLRTTQGTADGDTDLGTFTGTTITDANTVKGALQELETAHEATDALIDSHLDEAANKHDATEIDYERVDGSKVDIQAASDDVETALTDLDDNKLSRLAANTLTNLKYTESSLTAASSLSPTSVVVRLTGTAADLDGLNPTNTKVVVLMNTTNDPIGINNQSTGEVTPGNRIITGTGGAISLESGGSITLVYDSTTERWRVVGGTGSGATAEGGSGGVNYVTNPDFDTNLDGWVVSGGNTPTQETTAPLEGVGSLKWVSNGTAQELEGAISTIDDIDIGVLLAAEITIDVIDASGSYATGDYSVYVRNASTFAAVTTEADLVEGRNRYIDTFVAESGVTYEWVIVDNSANSTDYIIVDRAKITSDRQGIGANVGPTQTSIPTFNNDTGVTWVSRSMTIQRIGNAIHLNAHFYGSGAGSNSGNFQLVLPSYQGTSLIPANQIVGTLSAYQAVSADNQPDYFYAKGDGTNGYLEFVRIADPSNTLQGTELNTTSGSAEYSRFVLQAVIPVTAWADSGNINLLDRGIVTSNSRSAWSLGTTYVNSTSVTPLDFSVLETGTDYFSNDGAGTITIPADGDYLVAVKLHHGTISTGSMSFNLQKNGSTVRRIANLDATDKSTSSDLSVVLPLAAGDTLRVTQGAGGGAQLTSMPSGSVESNFSITRLASQSAVAPTGFGTSEGVGAERKYVLVGYQTETVAANGDFTAGSLKCVRIADTVTITATSALTFSSGDGTATSLSGLIPADYRPSTDQRNVYWYDSTAGYTFRVDSAGGIDIVTYNESALVSGQTTSIYPPSITFNIT